MNEGPSDDRAEFPARILDNPLMLSTPAASDDSLEETQVLSDKRSLGVLRTLITGSWLQALSSFLRRL